LLVVLGINSWEYMGPTMIGDFRQNGHLEIESNARKLDCLCWWQVLSKNVVHDVAVMLAAVWW